MLIKILWEGLEGGIHELGSSSATQIQTTQKIRQFRLTIYPAEKIIQINVEREKLQQGIVRLDVWFPGSLLEDKHWIICSSRMKHLLG